MKAIDEKANLIGLDLVDFAGYEHRNFLVSFGNNHEEINVSKHIQELFVQAMKVNYFDASEIVIPQLLVFIHYNYLYSMSSFMRGHIGYSYIALRAGVDAALAAAFIINDRKLQDAYINRSRPFDKLNRHIKNLPNQGIHIHPLLPKLMEIQKLCSEHAHADIRSFSQRLKIKDDGGKNSLSVEYFQFIRDRHGEKTELLGIMQYFLQTLEVFSDYLIHEKRIAESAWQNEIHAIGMAIDVRVTMYSNMT